MENKNRIKRSELWNKIYSIVSQIPTKEVEGDAVDYHSASTMIEELLQSQLKQERDVKTLIIEWEQYKKSNWWESEAIDVEKVLIDQFSNLKP